MLEALVENEICPSCGNWEQLFPITGFCLKCTRERYPNSAICENCGKIEPRGQFRTLCQECQKIEWFKRNADKIEIYMSIGLTFSMAFDRVHYENRPVCKSCGYKIKGGTRGRHFFCRTTPKCRSAGFKFKHLKEKGRTQQEALEETLVWLNERVG